MENDVNSPFTVTAKVNVQTFSNVPVDSPKYLTATPTVQGDPSRTPQQKVLPTAISNRFLTNLLSFGRQIIIAFSAPNGVSSIVTTFVSDNAGRPIFAIPQTSIYIGINDVKDVSFDNQWPTQTVGGGNFPIYFNSFNYGSSDNNDQSSVTVLRNNTGVSQDVLMVVQWKILTFPNNTDATNLSAAN